MAPEAIALSTELRVHQLSYYNFHKNARVQIKKNEKYESVLLFSGLFVTIFHRIWNIGDITMNNNQKRNYNKNQNRSRAKNSSQDRVLSEREIRRQKRERQKLRRQNEIKMIWILVLTGLALIALVAGVFKEIKNPSVMKADSGMSESGGENTADTLQGMATSLDMDNDEVNKQITSLIRQYRSACASGDVDAIARLYNTTELKNGTTFMAVATIITGYQNTECYIRPGLDDASRVVFIYDDLKLADFDTLVPNLSYVYVHAGKDGTFYIDPGTYNEETMSYEYGKDVLNLVDNLEGDSEIAELIKTVNEKFAQACDGNSELKKFIDTLTASLSANDSPSESESFDASKDTTESLTESETSQVKDTVSETKDSTAPDTNDSQAQSDSKQ